GVGVSRALRGGAGFGAGRATRTPGPRGLARGGGRRWGLRRRPLRLELQRSDRLLADVERRRELHGAPRIDRSLRERGVRSVDRLALFVEGRNAESDVFRRALSRIPERSLDEERGAVGLARVVGHLDAPNAGSLLLLVLVLGLVVAGRLVFERVRDVGVGDPNLGLLSVLGGRPSRVGGIGGRRRGRRRRGFPGPVGHGGGVPIDLRRRDREQGPV